MGNLTSAYSVLFLVCVCVLAVLVCCCLIRAIRGPRVADRIVAINMIGTLTMTILAILSVLLGEEYLLDVCLIYAMISFLAVVVVTKVYMGVHEQERLEKEKMRRLTEQKEEDHHA